MILAPPRFREASAPSAPGSDHASRRRGDGEGLLRGGPIIPAEHATQRGMAAEAARNTDLPSAWSSVGSEGVAFLLVVCALGSGWRLDGEGFQSVVFARGGDAERQGRRLARSVARLGRDAKVNVYDASGQLAGAITYYACRKPPGRDAACRYPWARESAVRLIYENGATH